MTECSLSPAPIIRFANSAYSSISCVTHKSLVFVMSQPTFLVLMDELSALLA